jgi:hypothetical protein
MGKRRTGQSHGLAGKETPLPHRLLRGSPEKGTTSAPLDDGAPTIGCTRRRQEVQGAPPLVYARLHRSSSRRSVTGSSFGGAGVVSVEVGEKEGGLGELREHRSSPACCGARAGGAAGGGATTERTERGSGEFEVRVSGVPFSGPLLYGAKEVRDRPMRIGRPALPGALHPKGGPGCQQAVPTGRGPRWGKRGRHRKGRKATHPCGAQSSTAPVGCGPREQILGPAQF